MMTMAIGYDDDDGFDYDFWRLRSIKLLYAVLSPLTVNH